MAGHSGDKWLVMISFLFTLGINSPALATQQDPDALIIQPVSTAKYLNAVDPEAVSKSWIAPWITMLEKSGYLFEVAPDNDEFLFHHLNEYDFVILPSSTCLNLDYQNHLEVYLNQGGGVILTGAFSCRDLTGNWQGCNFLEKYFGASPLTNKLESNQPLDLIMRRSSPGGMVAGAGFRLHFLPNLTPLEITPDTTVATVGGYWESASAKDKSAKLRPAYVYRQLEESGGRIVWFGTNLDSLIVPASEENKTTRFFRQLFKWTSGAGIAKMDVYPENYESAFIINAQVRNPNPDFVSIAEQLDDLSVKPVITLFTPLSPAQKNNLAQKIDADFDLILDITREESVSTEQAQKYIQELLTMGVKLTGLSVPPASVDSAFLSLAHDYQIPFLLVDSVVTAPFPHKIDPRFSTLVMAGPVVNFTTLAENYSITHPDSILAQIVTKLQRNAAIGGILRFNIDINNANPPAINELLKSLVKYSKKDDELWLTTFSNIAQRIEVCDNFEISTIDEADGMKVFVTSRNMDLIKNYTVRVLPQSPLIPEMSMITDLSANCTHSVKNGFFLIDLPKTASNETFTAKFVQRGGVAISANSQGIFSFIFKIAFFISVLFVGAFIWYFTNSKRQSANVLSPDGEVPAQPHAHTVLSPVFKKNDEPKEEVKENRPIHRPVLSISPERVFSSRPFPEADEEGDDIDELVNATMDLPILSPSPEVALQPKTPVVANAPDGNNRKAEPTPVTACENAEALRMKTFAQLKAREYQDVRRRKLSETYEPPIEDVSVPETESSSARTVDSGARSTVALDWLREPESGFTDRDTSPKPATTGKPGVSAFPPRQNQSDSSDYFRAGASVTAKLPRPESIALSRLKQGEKISATSSYKRPAVPTGSPSVSQRRPVPHPIVPENTAESGYRSSAPLPQTGIGPSVPKSQPVASGARIPSPVASRSGMKSTVQLPQTQNNRSTVLPEITKTDKTATRSTAPLPAREPQRTMQPPATVLGSTRKVTAPLPSKEPQRRERPVPSPGNTRKVTAPLPSKQRAPVSSSAPTPRKKLKSSVKQSAKTSTDIVATKSKTANDKSSDWL